MNKWIRLIITAAITVVAITFIYLWILGAIPNGMASIGKPSINNASKLTDANFSLIKLPADIQHEIRHYETKHHFTLDKWEFDSRKNNEINLYAHDIRNESAIEDLQGKQIGNYTIHIIHDTEFETKREEVEAYLTQLRKNPDYQIAWIGMVTDTTGDSPKKYVELWVYESTPKNKKLDNTVIQGWTIHVYPVSR
jgi:hypothetical protein